MMGRVKLLSATLGLCVISSAILPVAQASAAKELHDKHCQRCHDDSMYTRKNPLVLTYPALGERVRFCDNASGAHLSAPQLQSVVDYLNTQFYKFDKP